MNKKGKKIFGDINKDGIISGADVVYFASYIANLPGFELLEPINRADVNNDGEINGDDVVYLASHIAGLSGFELEQNRCLLKPEIGSF